MCCRRLHCIDSSVTAAEPLRHDVVIAVVCGSLHALQAPSSAMALYDHCSQDLHQTHCCRLHCRDGSESDARSCINLSVSGLLCAVSL